MKPHLNKLMTDVKSFTGKAELEKTEFTQKIFGTVTCETSWKKFERIFGKQK